MLRVRIIDVTDSEMESIIIAIDKKKTLTRNWGERCRSAHRKRQEAREESWKLYSISDIGDENKLHSLDLRSQSPLVRRSSSFSTLSGCPLVSWSFYNTLFSLPFCDELEFSSASEWEQSTSCGYTVPKNSSWPLYLLKTKPHYKMLTHSSRPFRLSRSLRASL